jgi:hypothetical protein
LNRLNSSATTSRHRDSVKPESSLLSAALRARFGAAEVTDLEDGDMGTGEGLRDITLISEICDMCNNKGVKHASEPPWTNAPSLTTFVKL